MEIDRNVSEYMQKRNIIACNISKIIAAQLMVVAVFFYAYYVLQNWDNRIYSLATARFVVKCVLVILSALIAIAGCVVTSRLKDMTESVPDAIGLRQSDEIVKYAFDKAKEVLVFKITLSIVILTGGITIAFLYMTIVGYGEAAAFVGRAVILLFTAVATIVFCPSFDRVNTYKGIINHKIRNRRSSMTVIGNSMSVIVPTTLCIYLLWRYFGNDRAMSFIVLPIGILILCTVCALFNKNNVE